jgi:hypothetical protein
MARAEIPQCKFLIITNLPYPDATQKLSPRIAETFPIQEELHHVLVQMIEWAKPELATAVNYEISSFVEIRTLNYENVMIALDYRARELLIGFASEFPPNVHGTVTRLFFESTPEEWEAKKREARRMYN